jgi:hypothetical protein
MDCRYTLKIHVIALSLASPAIGPGNNDGLQAKPSIDAFPPNPDAQSHQHEHAQELGHWFPNDRGEVQAVENSRHPAPVRNDQAGNEKGPQLASLRW